MRLLFLFVFCFSACQSPSNAVLMLFSGTEMTIDYKILIGDALTEKALSKVQEIIAASFDEINTIHNKWNPHSELSKLNQLKAFEKRAISPELMSLFFIADQLYQLTEGRFDPTIEPIQKLWKNSLRQGKSPTFAEIEAIKPTIGWTKIHFDQGIFWKEHDETSIDLCSIAKGLLVDLIIERLSHEGLRHLYVEWGGEIRALGEHPSQRPWRVFISQLGDSNPQNALAIIPLKNQAIATSGDYEQFWDCLSPEGLPTRYFHVMNPLTLRPLEIHPHSIASASIVAPNCVLADGLATSALLFENPESASKWLKDVSKKLPTMRYWLIDRSS
ncbi:Thiamine biosynthesis lipoprotein ApbE [Chlamydiales bacterium STE3]|nr:Thiamine biosynthesis lipoprotein ApbE [Chlamydiales bacterium STE3]